MSDSKALPRQSPTIVSATELEQLLQAAERAADAAAEITLRYFRSDLAVENKAVEQAFDPVTEADRRAELAIRESLRADYPGIGFLGEELDAVQGSNGLTWVVDPIDGTRAFMSGMPLWGTLIGLFDGQKVILGVMDQPFLAERYVAAAGVATLKDKDGSRALNTRLVRQMDDATLYCTTPDMFTEKLAMKRFQSIRQAVQLTRYGGDCYAYALLAAGFVDIVLDCDLQPYDIQALIPIVQSAGGIVTNWRGDSAVDGGYVVACGSLQLHELALALLNG